MILLGAAPPVDDGSCNEQNDVNSLRPIPINDGGKKEANHQNPSSIFFQAKGSLHKQSLRPANLFLVEVHGGTFAR